MSFTVRIVNQSLTGNRESLTGERELTALLKKLVDANVAEELRELNKLSQQGLHAATDQAPARTLTASELQGLAKRTLDVMEKI